MTEPITKEELADRLPNGSHVVSDVVDLSDPARRRSRPTFCCRASLPSNGKRRFEALVFARRTGSGAIAWYSLQRDEEDALLELLARAAAGE